MNIKYEDLPKPPILFCEVDVCFYLDFDMDKLNEIIGVNASEIRKMSETRINPVTHKKILDIGLIWQINTALLTATYYLKKLTICFLCTKRDLRTFSSSTSPVSFSFTFGFWFNKKENFLSFDFHLRFYPHYQALAQYWI